MLTIADLKNVSVFQGLAEKQLRLVYGLVTLRDYSSGDFIFTQGEPGDALFFVVTGRVKISVMAADGREKIIKIMEPGHVFGEVVLFDSGPYPASAQAMDACQVGILRNEDLYEMLREHDDLAISLLQLLAKRLKMTQRQLQDLALKDVYTRVAQLLLELAENEGIKLPCGSVQLTLRLTREEMAQMTATSRETLTRMLSELRQQGIISVERNQVHIPSLARLREVIV